MGKILFRLVLNFLGIGLAIKTLISLWWPTEEDVEILEEKIGISKMKVEMFKKDLSNEEKINQYSHEREKLIRLQNRLKSYEKRRELLKIFKKK